MSPPAIELAICTHANPAPLRECLRHIELQRVPEHVRWSTLVVDNDSLAMTAPVVEEFMARGSIPGLRLVHEPQLGLSRARARAMDESKATFVAFVDDDCLLDADWVEQAVNFFVEHPRAGAVGGRVDLEWDGDASEVLRAYARAYAWQNYGSQARQAGARDLAFLVGAGLVVRRDAVDESGWRDGHLLHDRVGAALSSGGDAELVLRVRRAGYEAWYNPGMRLRHVIPPRRTTIDHLCALNVGFGESEPALWTIARGSRFARHAGPPLLLLSALRGLALEGARFIISRVLRRPTAATFARVAAHRARGRMFGALRLIFRHADRL